MQTKATVWQRLLGGNKCLKKCFSKRPAGQRVSVRNEVDELHGQICPKRYNSFNDKDCLNFRVTKQETTFHSQSFTNKEASDHSGIEIVCIRACTQLLTTFMALSPFSGVSPDRWYKGWWNKIQWNVTFQQWAGDRILNARLSLAL